MLARHQISDLYETLGLPVEGKIDFAILNVRDIHPEIPFKSPDLKADYFSFILTLEGSGIYYLDDQRFPFGSGTIYFTNPGHIKSYELFESKRAYIIVLSDNFLREHIHPQCYTEYPFLLAEMAPPKKLSPQELEEFTMLYTQILSAFESKSDYKNQIMASLFTVLLLKIKETFWSDYNPIEEGNRNSQIVQSFKQLLESEWIEMLDNDHNRNRLQASYLADKMNLHPNYLNSVIKSKTGKTVNDWISNQIIATAKSLLTGTDYSSKEIAYKLGFSEPTHFSRFFKKQTDVSPGLFRKSGKSSLNL